MSGRSIGMRAIGEAIGVLVRGVRLVRSPRPIHPVGVVLEGTVEPIAGASASSGIEWIDEPRPGAVVGRLSRGIGTPVPFPDIWGLALRFRIDETEAGDLLVSSVGNLGVPWRFVPVARLSPHGARFATVMPYRSPTGPVLVGARTITGAPASASPAGVAIELGRAPWTLQLMWATPGGRWHAFATVSVRAAAAEGPGAVDRSDLRFDPVLAPPPGTETYGWTRALREPGYRAARRP